MEYLVVHVDPGPCLLLPVRHELISDIFLKVKRGPLRTYQSTDHQALRNVKTMSDKPVLSIYNWSRLWEGYKPLTWLPPRRGHLILKSQHTHWPVMWPLHTSSKDWHSEDSWLFQGLGLTSAPTAGITYLDSPCRFHIHPSGPDQLLYLHGDHGLMNYFCHSVQPWGPQPWEPAAYSVPPAACCWVFFSVYPMHWLLLCLHFYQVCESASSETSKLLGYAGPL